MHKQSLLKKIDLFLDRHTALLLLLLLVILLRIPNFFEPYWYGDEAIYLTIGQALNRGEQLYTTIIDHKTPIIYQLARVGDQFSFRLVNLLWMLMSTVAFFQLAKSLFNKKWAVITATLVMVILTSLPWLEGNIPNGELFVMGFVLVGAVFLSKTPIWTNFFKNKNAWPKVQLSELVNLSVAGLMFGLAILTKIPALLDLLAFLAIFALLLVNEIVKLFNQDQSLKKIIQHLWWRLLVFALAVLIPIVLSVIYFKFQGTVQDYLDYGLLYNLRYSQSWQLDLGSNFLNFSFSLLGKTLYLFLFILLIILNTQELSRKFQFISVWLVATLYSVLLSSRPYPHYFMQMVPAFALLLVNLIKEGKELNQVSKNQRLKQVKTISTGMGLLALIAYVMIIFQFQPYSTLTYYQNFAQLATGKISKTAYDDRFNYLVKDNRQVVKLIKELDLQKIFIWGTNPMLYAQSQTIPSSRFTVSFHIKDFNDYERTFQQIEADQPKLIVVMKDEQQVFPQLNNYLSQYYLVNTELDTMTLYLRQTGV